MKWQCSNAPLCGRNDGFRLGMCHAWWLLPLVLSEDNRLRVIKSILGIAGTFGDVRYSKRSLRSYIVDSWWRGLILF